MTGEPLKANVTVDEYTAYAVWMDLNKMKVAASTTIDRKFRAVFSQRRATRLKRLSLPIICSIRIRPR